MDGEMERVSSQPLRSRDEELLLLSSRIIVLHSRFACERVGIGTKHGARDTLYTKRTKRTSDTAFLDERLTELIHMNISVLMSNSLTYCLDQFSQSGLRSTMDKEVLPLLVIGGIGISNA